ncbi:MAG: hypothetical protein A2X67_02280 [Ignavibacteria bacterium GWA2_55_11]|nr:MAG: hypothetical protein A2X67_02280 [Ignavibacteria bacterium GWA2_55_11]OGU47722.1 MAG: hypothetical protein A2X68_01365 [Ignavibacteria bacterium GWC2_56_12]OGU66913.1 MAG: hypothetical protein A3C56_01490 [Ignavibacteria bacterium RIFCSPHIGHO2_02_FULL_56_12]OGU70486.1 MAG: hypothetical protein A3G43_03305 [Ignavibacteria bacterium RIFCSPLOWO2_12_FULL_56_21]OGU73937.1 MAG: hypothetical protein A3H45_14865 [Ignavibacteria bacterium RIFCSPLOWO2_02_FULL_55_14]HAV22942.1 hypothetical protei
MGQMKIMQTKWLAAQMLVVCLLALVTAASAQPTIPTDRGGLLAGEGMGLAAPAERNGFPGPKHVLELKDSLRLSRDQAKRTEELVEGVKVSAIAKGEQIVEAEEELEGYLAAGKVQEKELRAKLQRIGKLRAELRFVHLQAHLRMKQVLRQEQNAAYGVLRGVHGSH